MAKIQLILLDEEILYAEKLAAFIRTSEFADKLHTKLFTKMDYVEKLPAEELNGSILLVSGKFLPDCMKYQKQSCVLALTSIMEGVDLSDGDAPSLYRFQPLPQMLTRIIAYYQEKYVDYKLPSRKATQVVSLCSAIGNCGKTLSAIHLARELAFRGKKVFYLSLEAPSVAFLLLKGADSQHFSQALYYAKSAPEQLKAKLELLNKHDPRLGFDFLSPCHHIREAQEMSAEETRLLIEAFSTASSYDYIVLDLEASLHPRINEALRLSDHILWIVLDDLNCLHKTKAIKKMMGPYNGMRYVLNKYTGSIHNDFGSAGISFSGHLPYMPEWKTVHAEEQILTGSLFSDQVIQIFEASVLSLPEGAVV